MTSDFSRLLRDSQALAHLGAWEHDIATGTILWTDELFAILGLAPGAVAPSFEALLARVHPDDVTHVKAFVSRVRRERALATIEHRVMWPGGEIRTLQARARGIVDDGGALVRLVGVVQDITETKDVAARVVFSDRMVSLGTLAAGLAHEINNPLATIATQLQLLDEAHADAGTGDARAAVERIRSIVRGLSAFSRTDDSSRTSVDVHRVLDLAINLTSNEIRHRARLVRVFGALPYVNANEARLGHVFLNLLLNAAEAIPEGNANAHEIQIAAHTDDGGWAIVEVTDSGVGMAGDVVLRAFDPFFTTKPVGAATGLGLSICHGIVRSLGGDITVRSEPGRGTTFTVALPPSEKPPRTRPPSTAPATANPQRGHVLVIDDDALFASSLRRLLASEHQVTVVHSGRDALARLRAGERFDAILCDLMMPEMTGAELHAELVTLESAAADLVIFITGGAFSPASQKFLEGISNLVFEKPCDLAELRAAVRRRVATSRP